MPSNYSLVNSSNFDKALACIAQLEEVAVDTETYWTDDWDNKLIIGVSLYGEIEGKHLSLYFPYRHDWETQENLALDSLERLAKEIDKVNQVYHNAKYDRQEFLKEGIVLKAPFFCTMVASHMVDENSSHVLEDLAEKFHIDLQANARKQHIHDVRKQIVWHAIPPEIMVPYATGDTRNTYYLKKKLIPILEKQDLLKLWPVEEVFSDALMHIEHNGIEIDPVMAEEFSLNATRRMSSIKKELGFDPGKPLPLATKLFKELKLPIYEFGKPSKQFPRGRPKMDEATIDRLSKEASGEAKQVMQLILEYRGLQKARSTWYDGWAEKVDSQNKLHPHFSQHGTVTTRLSSSNPNMQQIPRQDDSVGAAPNPKRLLRAPKGYELFELDYSQVEYRLAGVLSKDPVILDSYRSGSDMHQATATKLGLTRQQAKTANFLFIYNGGPARYADVFGVSIARAKEIHEEYHRIYSTMFRFANRVDMTAAQRGYIRLWDGRRRHFRMAFECKKAWNSLVQGGAAVVMRHGIVNIHQDTTLLSKLCSQVHDSVWALIPEYATHTELAKLKYHLEWPSRDERFIIDFPTDVKRLA